tara:strand:+ start:7503 stop:7685 length:183 start_codon:yes stop_codon:yes gene_type:complete
MKNEDNLYVLLSFSLPYIKSEKNLVDFYKNNEKAIKTLKSLSEKHYEDLISLFKRIKARF